MAIFAIGDLHLSLGSSKPMDIFPGWNGYLPRLEENWRKLIAPSDTVVLAGDTSWAMKLEDTKADFSFLESLPGQKLLLKGNHDYWWSTANKMNSFLAAEGFSSLRLLHNNAFLVEGKLLCGTRSWMLGAGETPDEKITKRELGRLRMSLEAADALAAELPQGEPKPEKLAFLHYPPVYPGASSLGVVELLHQYGVERCYYGHLHGNAIHFAVQGEVESIRYKLISADGLGFCPYKI